MFGTCVEADFVDGSLCVCIGMSSVCQRGLSCLNEGFLKLHVTPGKEVSHIVDSITYSKTRPVQGLTLSSQSKTHATCFVD